MKNNDGTNAVIYGEKYQITDLIHGGIENYRHCETTAFFMQYLARLASSANEGFNAIPTALTFLAPKYGKTRFDFALHIRYLTLPLHISRCHTISYQINKQEDQMKIAKNISLGIGMQVLVLLMHILMHSMMDRAVLMTSR